MLPARSFREAASKRPRGLSAFAPGTTVAVVAEQKGTGTIRPRMVPLSPTVLKLLLPSFPPILGASQAPSEH
jgi:hypothetical protein